jgi:hypothetical protein
MAALARRGKSSPERHFNGKLPPSRQAVEAISRACSDNTAHRAGRGRADEATAARTPGIVGRLLRQRWSDALVSRCRALPPTTPDADAHFRAALAAHERPFDRARTELL